MATDTKPKDDFAQKAQIDQAEKQKAMSRITRERKAKEMYEQEVRSGLEVPTEEQTPGQQEEETQEQESIDPKDLKDKYNKGRKKYEEFKNNSKTQNKDITSKANKTPKIDGVQKSTKEATKVAEEVGKGTQKALETGAKTVEKGASTVAKGAATETASIGSGSALGAAGGGITTGSASAAAGGVAGGTIGAGAGAAAGGGLGAGTGAVGGAGAGAAVGGIGTGAVGAAAGSIVPVAGTAVGGAAGVAVGTAGGAGVGAGAGAAAGGVGGATAGGVTVGAAGAGTGAATAGTAGTIGGAGVGGAGGATAGGVGGVGATAAESAAEEGAKSLADQIKDRAIKAYNEGLEVQSKNLLASGIEFTNNIISKFKWLAIGLLFGAAFLGVVFGSALGSAILEGTELGSQIQKSARYIKPIIKAYGVAVKVYDKLKAAKESAEKIINNVKKIKDKYTNMAKEMISDTVKQKVGELTDLFTKQFDEYKKLGEELAKLHDTPETKRDEKLRKEIREKEDKFGNLKKEVEKTLIQINEATYNPRPDLVPSVNDSGRAKIPNSTGSFGRFEGSTDTETQSINEHSWARPKAITLCYAIGDYYNSNFSSNGKVLVGHLSKESGKTESFTRHQTGQDIEFYFPKTSEKDKNYDINISKNIIQKLKEFGATNIEAPDPTGKLEEEGLIDGTIIGGYWEVHIE